MSIQRAEIVGIEQCGMAVQHSRTTEVWDGGGKGLGGVVWWKCRAWEGGQAGEHKVVATLGSC